MKKIVMGMAAAAMAASMFAAEPAFNPAVTEFTGDASVKWGINLDKDEDKTGFVNSEGASFKVKLFDGGDKATEGEGIWGDIKVKVDADENFGIKAASIDHAKINFGENAYVGIRSGDTTVGGFSPLAAVQSSAELVKAVGPRWDTESDPYTQGIVAGYANDLFGIDVDFRSNKADQYTDDYALAAEASLKAVENLDLKAGVTMYFEDTNWLGYAATAGYKIAIDDTLYVKPAAGLSGVNYKDVNGNEVAAAVLLGWGVEADANAGVYFLDDDAAKKVTPGISVTYKNAIVKDADATKGNLKFAFFSGSSLVENLTAAALVNVDLDKDEDQLTDVKAGVKYVVNADEVKVTLNAGMLYACKGYKDAVAGTDAEYGWVDKDDNPATQPVWDVTKEAVAGTPKTPFNETVKVKVGVDVDGIIDNTTFFALYESGNLAADEAEKGTINVGCKIHF